MRAGRQAQAPGVCYTTKYFIPTSIFITKRSYDQLQYREKCMTRAAFEYFSIDLYFSAWRVTTRYFKVTHFADRVNCWVLASAGGSLIWSACFYWFYAIFLFFITSRIMYDPINPTINRSRYLHFAFVDDWRDVVWRHRGRYYTTKRPSP